MPQKISFVLGNGVSRKSINPEELRQHGTIYGCNALYRTFSPDYLIAVDTKMIIEITDIGYHLDHEVWSNPNKLTKRTPGINLFNPNKGWSSGPTALWMASTHQADTIYILGFDYVGIGDDNDKVNNLYAGTKNYKRVEDRATYYGNWTRQTSTAIKSHPRTKYVRIIEKETSFIPEHLQNLNNLEHILLEDFKKNFKLNPYNL